MQNHEELNDKTYRKLLIYEDGDVTPTTAPPELLLGEHVRYWVLSKELMIGYCKNSAEPNVFWEALRLEVPEAPRLFGDFVLWRFGGLNWNEDVARNELRNFLVTRYKRGGHPYHFCSFKREGL